MSAVEAAFCRSAPWRAFARRTVLPWALREPLVGRVLEIGAGSGAMAAGVVELCPEASLTVTDVDPAMVAAARARLGSRARVEVADVTALPYPAASFDVVTSYLMLHHVVAWPSALAEAARVLRPGGRFVGYDAADTLLARVVHRADRSPFALLTPMGLRLGLTRAGFAEVSVEPALGGLVMRFSGTLAE
jgi:SAM-dependent methyltransferase